MIPLTADELRTIQKIYHETGILTVKDKQTMGKDFSARAYGERYHPLIKHALNGRDIFDENIQCERTVIRHFTDSSVFPGGVPIGNTQRFQRHTLRNLGGDESFRYIGGQDDICKAEFNQVRALAYGQKWLTAEERAEDEKKKEAARAKRTYSDLNPVGEIAEALKSALAGLANTQGSVIPPLAGGEVPVITSDDDELLEVVKK